MFLSVPIMAVVKLLVTEFIEYRNTNKNNKLKENNIRINNSINEDNANRKQCKRKVIDIKKSIRNKGRIAV